MLVRRALVSTALAFSLAAASACSDATAPDPHASGHFKLVAVNGIAIPAYVEDGIGGRSLADSGFVELSAGGWRRVSWYRPVNSDLSLGAEVKADVSGPAAWEGDTMTIPGGVSGGFPSPRVTLQGRDLVWTYTYSFPQVSFTYRR